LGTLIDRTKKVLDDRTGQDNMPKLVALQVLEKQRKGLGYGFFFLFQSCHDHHINFVV